MGKGLMPDLENIELRCSPSGERNKQPILEVLKKYIAADTNVLEIGSGTGQHAVFFTRNLPGIRWQMSEMPENLEVLQARKLQQGNERMPEPIALDCRDADWHIDHQYELAFSANTAHIMSWQGVCGLLHGVSKWLKPDGVFLLYGPFRYRGQDTAHSNTDFHQHLKNRSPEMGLRDYYEMQALATQAGLDLQDDIPMPANNRILVFRNAE